MTRSVRHEVHRVDRCADARLRVARAKTDRFFDHRAAPLSSRGFTYVGLMILLALIALASAAALSTGAAMDQRAKEEELLFVGGEFARAFRSYFESTPAGQRNYPATLEDLLKDPRYPGLRRHLRRIYVDPMTGKPEWGTVAVAGGIVGVHSLSNEAPVKVAEFAPEYIALSGKKTYKEWAFGFLPPGVPIPGSVSLAGQITAPATSSPPASQPPVSPFASPPGSATSGVGSISPTAR